MTYEQARALAAGRGVSLKPILFSTPMVQAILEGRKTMTRRVLRPQPKAKSAFEGFCISGNVPEVIGKYFWVFKNNMGFPELDVAVKPRHNVGDILWVRETWAKVLPDFAREKLGEGSAYPYGSGKPYIFKASPCEGWIAITWKPSIFMPREAARLFLEVKSVRVERLQDISEADAKAEGILSPEASGLSQHSNFQYFWNKLNAKRGYSWNNNPWVWVIEFERRKKNA